MTRSIAHGQVPQWDLADRLRKSLREADMGVQEMADYLEVSRNTVSAWINGRTEPRPRDIRLWALRTGLPYEWVKDGQAEDLPPDDGGPAADKPVGGSWLDPTPAPIIQLRPTG